MRRLVLLLAAVVASVAAGVAAWKRNPRLGTRLMNERVNPFLLERGLSGAGRSEIGTLEHVGRVSGMRRLTPVHPEPTEDGFRIIAPLGLQSEWVRNVLAAGHCRLQLHDSIYELDEPSLVAPREVTELPRGVRWACDALGFRYVRLHRFGERVGALEPLAEQALVLEGEVPSTDPVETPANEAAEPAAEPVIAG